MDYIIMKPLAQLACLILALTCFGQPDGLRLTADRPDTDLTHRELKDGKLVLYFRKVTFHFYPEGVQTSAEIWKEIYGVKDGAIVFEETVKAEYTPEQKTTTTEPEKITWPK